MEVPPKKVDSIGLGFWTRRIDTIGIKTNRLSIQTIQPGLVSRNSRVEIISALPFVETTGKECRCKVSRLRRGTKTVRCSRETEVPAVLTRNIAHHYTLVLGRPSFGIVILSPLSPNSISSGLRRPSNFPPTIRKLVLVTCWRIAPSAK